MIVSNNADTCKHDLKVKIRNGSNIVKVKPLFNHDSQYIFVASGSDVKVYNVRSGECVHTLRNHTKPVISIQEYKKNDLQILTCSDDCKIVRWDYLEGKLLQVYDVSLNSCTSFYAPHGDSWFACAKKIPKNKNFKLYKINPENGVCREIMKQVLPYKKTIAFGFKCTFCVSVVECSVRTYKFESQSFKKHFTGDREQLCVVTHPSDYVFATGDSHGRITVWSKALDSSHPIKSIYHWHTLPVADLAFSIEGNYIYSGGGEAALVKWNLYSDEKFVLPRMGAPILYVSASRSNAYIATAHTDNAIQVVDTQSNIIQIIQGLTKAHFQGLSNGNLLPTGLLYNSHLKALVMNGKPGHLQFYDIYSDKQLFNLDITAKNLLSQERDATIFNIDVQKAAMDDSGFWLATTEYWGDGESSPQIWLKFWLYDCEKQTFVLNTNVILPHNQPLNCILFRPDVPSMSLPLAVTTSNDGRFKIWNLSYQKDHNEEKKTWSCDAMGCYRNLPASSACFSEEGSLLAVAFESAATLWNVERTTLKAVLCPDNYKRNIKQLVFGHHSCCQYLICHDELSLTVWNVLTLSIVWIVHNEVQYICSDKCSENIAAICKNQQLIIFKPSNPTPVYNKETISETSVISALFVPDKDISENEENCFHNKSRLFFFNENQNLLTLSNEADEDVSAEKRKIAQNLPETPFSMLQAEQKKSDVAKIKADLLTIKTKQNGVESISNPTFQNPIGLCSTILRSLLTPLKRTDEANQMVSDEEKDDLSSDEENFSNDKSFILQKPEEEIATEITADFSMKEFKIRSLNFDFLKNLEKQK